MTQPLSVPTVKLYHHGKAGNGFLGNQQESRIAHGRGQGRDNTAKGQASGDILRHHDDRTAASGECAEAGSDRYLPDRVAPQHCRGVDSQRALKSVDAQDGSRDKRADLKVGIGNRAKMMSRSSLSAVSIRTAIR